LKKTKPSTIPTTLTLSPADQTSSADSDRH
jgi:hypothetical protein